MSFYKEESRLTNMTTIKKVEDDFIEKKKLQLNASFIKNYPTKDLHRKREFFNLQYNKHHFQMLLIIQVTPQGRIIFLKWVLSPLFKLNKMILLYKGKMKETPC